MSIFLPEMNQLQEQAVLPNSGSAAHHSKTGNSRGKCQEKESCFSQAGNQEKGDLMSRGHLRRLCAESQ